MPRTDTYPGSLRRRNSGSWQWRCSIAGERVQETWDAELTETEAERKARERYNLLQAQSARGDGATVRLKRLLAVYRDQRLPALAESSQQAYEITFKALETYYGNRDPRLTSIGRGDMKGFLSWRRVHGPDGTKRGKPLSGWSLRRCLSVLSTLFEEAVEREWIDGNPARRISVETPDTEPVILSEEEYEKLLEQCEARPMLRTFILLAGEAGLRRSEALDLRWADVDLRDGFLEVVHGRDGRTTKGKRSRAVPMTSRLRRELRDHAARFRLDGTGSAHLLHHVRSRPNASKGDPFGRFDKGVRKVAEKAGLPEEWRYHDLRHRRCTLWLAEGYSPEKVRRAMGHSSLSTTLQYSHLVRSDLEEMVGDRDELQNMVG